MNFKEFITEKQDSKDPMRYTTEKEAREEVDRLNARAKKKLRQIIEVSNRL